jgi:hypothetical protein
MSRLRCLNRVSHSMIIYDEIEFVHRIVHFGNYSCDTVSRYAYRTMDLAIFCIVKSVISQWFSADVKGFFEDYLGWFNTRQPFAVRRDRFPLTIRLLQSIWRRMRVRILVASWILMRLGGHFYRAYGSILAKMKLGWSPSTGWAAALGSQDFTPTLQYWFTTPRTPNAFPIWFVDVSVGTYHHDGYRPFI